MAAETAPLKLRGRPGLWLAVTPAISAVKAISGIEIFNAGCPPYYTKRAVQKRSLIYGRVLF